MPGLWQAPYGLGTGPRWYGNVLENSCAQAQGLVEDAQEEARTAHGASR